VKENTGLEAESANKGSCHILVHKQRSTWPVVKKAGDRGDANTSHGRVKTPLWDRLPEKKDKPKKRGGDHGSPKIAYRAKNKRKRIVGEKGRAVIGEHGGGASIAAFQKAGFRGSGERMPNGTPPGMLTEGESGKERNSCSWG